MSVWRILYLSILIFRYLRKFQLSLLRVEEEEEEEEEDEEEEEEEHE